MIARYRLLAQRIEKDREQLEETRNTIERHWERSRTATLDREAYINSVALNLHSLYSGLERIFQLIALEFEGGTLGGEEWHSELLRQMTLDIPDVRPPVISQGTAARLDEHRKFRHLVRHIYALELEPDRMRPLAEGLDDLWRLINRDLDKFRAFLEQLSQADA